MNTAKDLKALPLSALHPDPRNPNVMDGDTYGKIRDHIQKTGHYPTAIVRQLPVGSQFYDLSKDGPQYMLLDGHHRALILTELGQTEMMVDDWGEMADDQAGLYLGTLNYNTGEADAGRLGLLYHDISATMTVEQISMVVPQNVVMIEELIDLRLESLAGLPEFKEDDGEPEDTASALRVLLFPAQRRTVDVALRIVTSHLEGKNKLAQGLEMLAADYLSGVDPQTRAAAEADYLRDLTGAGEADPYDDPDTDALEGS